MASTACGVSARATSDRPFHAAIVCHPLVQRKPVSSGFQRGSGGLKCFTWNNPPSHKDLRQWHRPVRSAARPIVSEPAKSLSPAPECAMLAGAKQILRPRRGQKPHRPQTASQLNVGRAPRSFFVASRLLRRPLVGVVLRGDSQNPELRPQGLPERPNSALALGRTTFLRAKNRDAVIATCPP